MLKKISGLLFVVLFLGNSLLAQIVITEVFYNAPGPDTIEYIELYNNSAADINLQGYNFTQGIVYAFPDFVLGAGEYVVVANNAPAMFGYFGISSFQWFTGGLNNDGEDIQLNNADTSMVIDYINYDDGLFWPSAANGNGFSMELCDPNENNADPGNWYPSLTNAQFVLAGLPIYGSPALVNEVVCNPPAATVTSSGIAFTAANVTIYAGQTVKWMNVSGAHNVNGSMATYPGNAPEFFFSGAPSSAAWTFSHTFNTPGTYNYRCDIHFNSGMVGTVTVLPIPTYDLVINEIMYNPPGVDLIGEFIELYNNQPTSINLNDFSFAQGIEYTFPNVSIAAGEYLIIASDSVAFTTQYGVPARQWTSGALSNMGEEIVLKDNLGFIVDIVLYDNNSPFAEIANGEGPSLILCDPSIDNLNPANWKHAVSNTGVIPPGANEFVFASPGAANNCPSEPHLFFNGLAGTVGEGEMLGTFTVRMPVLSITDSADVNIVVNAALTTATEGIDFSIINTTLHFSPDAPGEISEAEILIGLIDDLTIEGDETIVLQMQNAVGATIATTGFYTITIIDNDGVNYPVYPIGTVSTVNADGVADSLNVKCSLTGVVHGVNLRDNYLQFTIIDNNNDGIGVFSDSSAFGYTVTEGNLVTVQGVIEQFNGLLQIVPDTVKLISPLNPLWFPNVVTSLDESTESQLVRFNNMSLVNPAQWTNTGAGFNVTITNGVDQVQMRIDADTDIFGTAVPTGTFDVIGIGGQFDTSIPLDGGYQFLPRYQPDIMLLQNPELDAIDDVVNIQIDEVVVIEVLANDNIPTSISGVNIGILPAIGTVVVNNDFTITYTPDSGVCGEDAFSYIACDNNGCDEALVTITIECPSTYPLYEIAVVTTNDAEGIADSLDVTCELRGVVYGVNLRSDGLQFTIIDEDDANAGIGVFSASDTYGYTVTEGDRVACLGAVGQFNGLTQIYLDSMYLVSAGATLHDPAAVTQLNESTESKLVKIFNVTLVNPTQWTGTGAGFNVDVTDGTNTYVVRIDNNVSLYSAPAPSGTINITGIGGQFDLAAPYTEGFQLLPRYDADIEMAIATAEVERPQVSIFPNPAGAILNVNAAVLLDEIEVYNQLGQLLYSMTPISNNNIIPTIHFAPGFYVIRMEKDGFVWGEKFVKE
jgi:plastocyanin/DNA/RNA endonuclease YhcR with UshA esterase domain